MTPADITTLSRAGAPSALVARPRSRAVTRVLLPAAVIVAALAMLAYAVRETLRPALAVRVAPVVSRGSGGASGVPGPAREAEVVQAPGWIEADPYAISVPALQPGVLREVLALEGERVEAGQVVARLVDDDAKNAERRARAGVEQADAALTQARAALLVDEARAAEIEDEATRKETLLGFQAVGQREVVSARLRLRAQRAAVEASLAAVGRAEAETHTAQVGLDEASLALARTEVRAPIAGVVLARLVEPGQRVMPDDNNPFAGVVVRLYDPAKLQVRVDVPLADAAKVRMGDPAEIGTEALSERIFKGEVVRLVHEANLQKNTVQVKVAIREPSSELRPEMLARVRITARAKAAEAPNNGDNPATGWGAVLAPKAALRDASAGEATVWVLDVQTSTAQPRRVKLGRAEEDGVEVRDGLRPGDRVILDAPEGLKPGTKVRPTETGVKP